MGTYHDLWLVTSWPETLLSCPVIGYMMTSSICITSCCWPNDDLQHLYHILWLVAWWPLTFVPCLVIGCMMTFSICITSCDWLADDTLGTKHLEEVNCVKLVWGQHVWHGRQIRQMWLEVAKDKGQGEGQHGICRRDLSLQGINDLEKRCWSIKKLLRNVEWPFVFYLKQINFQVRPDLVYPPQSNLDSEQNLCNLESRLILSQPICNMKEHKRQNYQQIPHNIVVNL